MSLFLFRIVPNWDQIFFCHCIEIICITIKRFYYMQISQNQTIERLNENYST